MRVVEGLNVPVPIHNRLTSYENLQKFFIAHLLLKFSTPKKGLALSSLYTSLTIAIYQNALQILPLEGEATFDPPL